MLAERFDRGVLRLSDVDRDALPGVLANAGVYGGASYDGLIALEAQSHEHALLTLDKRAQLTYRRLGVPYRAI